MTAPAIIAPPTKRILTQASVHVNVDLCVRRHSRKKSGLWRDERWTVENRVPTEGLAAICFNAVSASGSPAQSWLAGSGTALPADADTTLATETGRAKSLYRYMMPPASSALAFKIELDTVDNLELDGTTINELGIQSGDTGGATAADDRLLARVLTGRPIVKDQYTEVYATWRFTVRPKTTQTASGVEWYNFGRRFFASKVISLSQYGILDAFAFGTGTPTITTDTESLGTQAVRDAATWTSSAATVSCSTTVTHAATMTEAGPATGRTGANTPTTGVLLRLSGFSVDTTSSKNYACTIALSNAEALAIWSDGTVEIWSDGGQAIWSG